MSPERTSSRLRYSEGSRKHLRKERTAKNKSETLITPEESKRKIYARPSWETVFGIIELRTYNNPDQNVLLHDNRLLLRDYYEAVVSGSLGSYRKMKRFKKEYEPDNQPAYNPSLNQHMGIIRGAILGPITRKRR